MINCNISNCGINSSSYQQHQEHILTSTNTIMRTIVNRWDDVPQHHADPKPRR